MKLLQTFAPILSALLALIGCTKAELLNITIPKEGYTVHKDIAYGTGPRQKLDVYVPTKPDADHTVIVFFYGGSWKTGEKELYKFVGEAFTSKGYTVVVPDYRIYPEVYFPTFMKDSAASVAWVHKHIGEYGGDTGHVYLSGHSAGAYNAMMLTLNQEYLKEEGQSTEWIRGIIGLAGPYDFLPFTDPDIIAIFSKVEDKVTQPINYVRKNLPPVLLLHGDSDDEVSIRNDVHLAAKLREYHNQVETHYYTGVGHIGVVLSLAHGFRSKAPTLEDIDGFIRSTNGR